MLLSLVVMAPTFDAVSRNAVAPYAAGKLSQRDMLMRAFAPVEAFMLRQAHRKDVALFRRLAKLPATVSHPPPTVLIPAFIVGELRSAFAIGFALYLPFVAIDLAVASILMGLGMFMLSPPVVSLPCKLLLFVMVDGWALVCGGIVATFR